MKDLWGQYVLTETQMDHMIEAIKQQFDLDNCRVLHPAKINTGHRHIDIAYASNEKETYMVSFGCSAKRIRKTAWRDANWFNPFVEVYLKFKATDSEIFRELLDLYSFCMRAACSNFKDMDSKIELGLLNGYEYMFIDEDEAYHYHKGYWGAFICPRFKKTVSDVGNVLFYQLIPAYKEELEFVEKHTSDINYNDLCQAIAEHIDERQYFDVNYNKLTEKELDGILASVTD